jgi:maltose O-acetyltransferase
MRLFWYIAYYGFARWLPSSRAPFGAPARRIRAWTARRLLAECGHDVNIERGAHFGGGRGIVLGDRSGIGIDSQLIGPVRLGRDVMMGPRVTILTQNHAFSDLGRPMNEQGAAEVAPVTIEDDVWIGMATIILPGVTIGTGAVVGAGSVVTKSIPPYAVSVGNPARVIRDRRKGSVS